MENETNLSLPNHTIPPKKRKTTAWWWLRDLFWLFLMAIFFRWLVLEPYTIPTASMEGTIWRGDFILVSKWHYGARTPNTWFQIPLTFRKIWFTSWDSYVDFPQARLPITRLPALSSVKRGDLLVFNYPKELAYPVELRTPYIKRCMGLAGDTLLIEAGKVYVNGQESTKIHKRKHRYLVQSSEEIPHQLFKKLHIEDFRPLKANKGHAYLIDATRQEIGLLGKNAEVKEIIMQNQPKEQIQTEIFPNTPQINWNEDNFGAVIIPKKGMTVQMSAHNTAIYGQLIRDYELYGNVQKVDIKQDKLYINGEQMRAYTFQQDYFFALGDNFHNSVDSRFWGFVPQDHLIGKAFFVWFSLSKENKIRWDRIGGID